MLRAVSCDKEKGQREMCKVLTVRILRGEEEAKEKGKDARATSLSAAVFSHRFGNLPRRSATSGRENCGREKQQHFGSVILSKEECPNNFTIQNENREKAFCFYQFAKLLVLSNGARARGRGF